MQMNPFKLKYIDSTGISQIPMNNFLKPTLISFGHLGAVQEVVKHNTDYHHIN